ncbi:MAG TPA: GNAT family N-acetyltransferase [Rhodopila sp.]|uniref:GNAT family N-acetyltransferase n=1 Tax=Rhodopila sp. TaxID=2480087 RepID=UPI002C917E4C|nr:GNAT family N-acetyltransferase [Rhodopila sp.]HVY14991.1 GNAT family N-acetyltransferase [Rhodopila sp.]
MTLRIAFVRTISGFTELREPWQDLWSRAGGSIFQHHDWLHGWMAGIQTRRDIRILVALAWHDTTLVAAMPLAVHRRHGVRMLCWAGQLFSDYCDALTDRETVLPELWQAVLAAGGFDVIKLQQVRPDAACRSVLQAGPLASADRHERCMRIDIRWNSGAEFFRSLNKKGRNNHTRGKRILGEIGSEPVFRLIEPDRDATPMFDEIWRLKEAWLRVNDPASPLLGTDRVVQRSVLDGAWRTGLTRIFLIECGGQVAAASVNFVYANRMEAYLTAYDARFERASPGTILIVEYTQWACDRGLAHVDFLRGDEAFKSRLANAETILTGYQGARTLLGHLATSGHRLLSRRRGTMEAAPAKELEPV